MEKVTDGGLVSRSIQGLGLRFGRLHVSVNARTLSPKPEVKDAKDDASIDTS